MFALKIVVHHEISCPVVYNQDSGEVADELSCLYLQCLALVHYNPIQSTRLFNPELPVKIPVVSSIDDETI